MAIERMKRKIREIGWVTKIDSPSFIARDCLKAFSSNGLKIKPKITGVGLKSNFFSTRLPLGSDSTDELSRAGHSHTIGSTAGKHVNALLKVGKSSLTVKVRRLFAEWKWADADPDRSLRYLKARFPDAVAWQISATGNKDYLSPDGIGITPAVQLLRALV